MRQVCWLLRAIRASLNFRLSVHETRSAMNQDITFAWKYHNLTKHSYWSVRTAPHYLDWANQPYPFKIYLDAEPMALPREFPETGATALEALARTELAADGSARPNLRQLSSILYHCAGVTKEKRYPTSTIYFRAAACAGALYPVEVYVVCGPIDGLQAGVYHFNPGDFALRQLREGDWRGALIHATAHQEQVCFAPIILVCTAISWRSSWKYRERAYRYHYWDNGMIAANALAMASAYGLPAEVVMGFVDEEVNRLVGIDGQREFALSLLTVGREPVSEAIPKPLPPEDVPEINPRVAPLSHHQVDYPLIYEMHRASSLTSPDEVAAWRKASATSANSDPDGEASQKLFPLSPIPDEQLPTESLEDVIQRRASTRRFALKPLPFAELSVILDTATHCIPSDFLKTAQPRLNDIYLTANRVDGLEAGAYFYHSEHRALELLKRGDFSEEAAYLTLEQDLGGNSAATIFFMADLNAVLGRFGNRGYRVTQMEAGIIGGKVYLASYAMRRGATGLTFYDDDVTRFFSPQAANKSCTLVVAVGIAGKRPLY
jgi:SagB-type dehydrogenase family enzyme